MMLSMASSSNSIIGNFSASSDTLVAIAGILTAITSVVNLILVIFFFFRERTENYNKEKNRVKEENYVNWYRLLVIERLIKEMDIFFEELTKIIMEISEKSILGDKLQENLLLSQVIERVKNIFNQKKRILLPTLELFSNDLKTSVWTLFQENHDQILNEIEKIFVNSQSNNKALELINETKLHIYKELYEFDLNKLNEIVLKKENL
jgi:hypothetical protein